MGSSETCLCVRGYFVCPNRSMAQLEIPRKRHNAVRMQRREVGAAEGGGCVGVVTVIGY